MADSSLTSGTGMVLTDFGTSSADFALSSIIQQDGKVVVGGYSNASGSYDFALARYNADGSLDTTFNGSGKVLTDFGGGLEDVGYSVTQQGDGKIIVAGYSTVGGSDGFALARYNQDGSLDTTFNGTGKVVTDVASSSRDYGQSVALQSDGKILVGGYSLFSSYGEFAVTRYNPDGTLDTSFNGTGRVITAVGSTFSFSYGQSVTVQPDGKILVAGQAVGSTGGYEFALARYNADGSLDATFNGTGKVLTDVGGGSAASSVTLEDGKILVAGFASTTNSDFALVRYNADGSLDTSFNHTGEVVTDFGSNSNDQGFSVAVQGDGKILVGGTSASGSNNFAVARYNIDGSLDTTFNGSGKVVTDIGSNTNDVGRSISVQSDGKIVVAGYSTDGGSYNFCVVRYNADGSLDTSFGAVASPGGLTESAVVNGYVNAANDIAAQTLTGVAEPGSTVGVYDGGSEVGTSKSGSDGKWSFTLGVLTEGTHSLTATATDIAGNVSAASAALTFTVDTQSPGAPATLTDASINANGWVNAATDTSAQALTGSAEAGSTVTVYDGANKLGTTAADSTGAWSYTLGSLADGAHTLTATATDVAGNTGAASAALAFSVDTAAPNAPTALADAAISGGYVNQAHDTASQALTGSAEAGSTVTVYDGSTLLNTVTADSSGSWSYTLGVLADGAHSLTATATDAAGNTGAASAALSFNVDTVAPNAPASLADAAISGGYVNQAHDTASQALTGSAEGGSTVTVYDGANKLGTTTADSTGAWSYTLGTLSDGAHSLTATATDAAGNTGPSGAALSFKVDTSSPGTIITDVAQTKTTTGTMTTLSGTTEANSVVSLFDSHGAVLLSNIRSDASGAWTASLANVQNVLHDFTASAVDSAGNGGALSNHALLGTTGNDSLSAVGGGDVVQGNGGQNAYVAAAGTDYFVFHPGFGKNAISGFNVTQHVLEFARSVVPKTVTNDAQLCSWLLSKSTEVNGTTVIAVDAQDTVTLLGVSKALLSFADFHLM